MLFLQKKEIRKDAVVVFSVIDPQIQVQICLNIKGILICSISQVAQFPLNPIMDHLNNLQQLNGAKNLFQERQYFQALNIFLNLYEKNDTGIKQELQDQIAKCYEQLEDWESLQTWLYRLEETNLKNCLGEIIKFQSKFGIFTVHRKSIQRHKVRIYYGLVFPYLMMEKYNLAIDILKTVYFQELAEALTQIELRSLMDKMEATESMWELCNYYDRKLIGRFSKDPRHCIRKAKSLAKQNKFNEALIILKEAANKLELNNSKKALLFAQIGRIYTQVDQEEARDFFIKATQFDPNEERIYFQFAKLLFSRQIRPQSLQNTFNCFLYTSDPSSAVCQMLIKIQLINQRRQSIHLVEYPKSILQLGKEWSRQITYLSVALWQPQHLKDYFTKNPIFCSHFNRRKGETLMDLAMSHEMLRDYQFALQCYTILLKQDISQSHYKWELGCALNLARTGKQQQAFIRNQRFSKNSQVMYLMRKHKQAQLCELYFRISQFPKCIMLFEDQERPTRFEAYLWVIKSYLQLGQRENVKTVFQSFFTRKFRQYQEVEYLVYSTNDLIKQAMKRGHVAGSVRLIKLTLQTIGKMRGIYGQKSFFVKLQTLITKEN